MRILLDTHAFLWALSDPSRLNRKVVGLIADRSNEVFVSAASVWEIGIKKARGKLKVTGDIQQEAIDRGFSGLPISLAHAESAGALPLLHHDPFDRMLIAQAAMENLTLLTDDARISLYAVRALRAGQ